MTVITRFAPSPTGRLHIGHAYSALFAYNQAQAAEGRFLLRIEDIDPGRCHKEFEDGIYEDLAWLGLTWEQPVRRQSEHMADYKKALGQLRTQGLLYPCFCTRKDIKDEIERSGAAQHGVQEHRPEGPLYPGICKGLSDDERAAKIDAGRPYALRLDMDKALAAINKSLCWVDEEKGEQRATPEIVGDAVLARKDIFTSYHLSVTLDDHLQGVTLVTRGEELFYASHLHRLLQELLGLDVPRWHHHGLITDEKDDKLSKRDKAITLQNIREDEQKSPQDVIRMIGAFMTLMLALIIYSPAQAQAQDRPPLQQEAIDHIRTTPHKTFLSLSIENDSLGRGTDQNYTSGVRISYFDVNAAIPSSIDMIADYIPTFDINETTSIAYSLGQNLYTPDDVENPQQDPDDRPWAGWLYVSAGLTTLTGNHIDELELTLGMVGPAALGRPAQDFVHDTLDTTDPRGWDNQLDNEPGVIVSWLRRWPHAARFEAMGFYGALEPQAGITLGNVYTYANTGFNLRLSPQDDRWQDHPPRVRPAIPGTGYFQIPNDDWSWYLFAGAEGRAVGRNIFLDGNTFADSHRVDKKHFVADLNTGIAFTYQRVRLSYTLTYRTEEFHGQDRGDLFGSLSLSYRY